MKLSIVIPVFNEEKTIEEVVRQVHDVSIPHVSKQIIVVNDASIDKTSIVLQKIKNKYKDIVILTHETNKGKGAALQTGFEKVSGEYVVIQDADLEYDPQFLIGLMEPIVKKEAEVVYGTRLKRLPHIHNEESKPRFLLHYFGNRMLSLMTSILYWQWITDMETCYKIFPSVFLRNITLSGNGFDFEPEVTAKLIKKGYKIIELPITTKPRGYQEGKKLQTFPEGARAVWALIKYRFTN